MGNLNKNIFSDNYKKAIKKEQTPIYLNEIYNKYLEFMKNKNVTPSLSILEVSNILLESRQSDKIKYLKQVEWHHQGTTLFANNVFFSNPKESKADALNRIIEIIKPYEVLKKQGILQLKRSEEGLRRSFTIEINKIFKATNRNINRGRINKLMQSLESVVKQYVDDIGKLVVIDILVNNMYMLEDRILIHEYLENRKVFIEANEFVRAFSLSQEQRKRLTMALDKTRLSIKKTWWKFE